MERTPVLAWGKLSKDPGLFTAFSPIQNTSSKFILERFQVGDAANDLSWWTTFFFAVPNGLLMSKGSASNRFNIALKEGAHRHTYIKWYQSFSHVLA